MKRYAIVLAAEEYEHANRTAFCHADAELLRETLIRTCGFAEQDTVQKLLAPAGNDTPASILREIDDLISASEPGDTVVFFYAGHGAHENGESYLVLPGTVPSQLASTAIPLRDVSQRLRKFERLCVRVFDACHSGQDVRGPLLNGSEFTRAISKQAGDGWATFASCQEDQSSFADPASGHGIFTLALCEAITEAKPGEPIFPEEIKLRAFAKTESRANQLGHSQTPVFNSSIRGNIAFATRIEPAPEEDTVAPPHDAARSIQDRLATVRSFPATASQIGQQALSDYLGLLTTQLSNALSDVETFGGKSKVLEPARAEDLPESLYSVIFEGVPRGFVPVHSLKKHREPIEDWMALSILPRRTRYRSTVTLEQPGHYPACWTGVRIAANDRHTPTGMLLVYLLPGQLSAQLVAVHAIAGVKNSLDEEWDAKETKRKRLFLSNQDREQSEITAWLREQIPRYNEVFSKAVEERLAVLEAEIKS